MIFFFFSKSISRGVASGGGAKNWAMGVKFKAHKFFIFFLFKLDDVRASFCVSRLGVFSVSVETKI